MRTPIAELVRSAAATLLAHHAAGRHCDPLSVAWARQMLRQNPRWSVATTDAQPEKPRHAAREI